MGDSNYDVHGLIKFLEESNRIEGIVRGVTDDELWAARGFLELEEVGVPEMVQLVHAFQPDAMLRSRPGLDVQVGGHVPPPGGPLIVHQLANVCLDAASGHHHPWLVHRKYEDLHPFTDGNGRSGRLLWAWQMLREKRRPGIDLGFLHAYYYQTLELCRDDLDTRHPPLVGYERTEERE